MQLKCDYCEGTGVIGCQGQPIGIESSADTTALAHTDFYETDCPDCAGIGTVEQEIVLIPQYSGSTDKFEVQRRVKADPDDPLVKAITEDAYEQWLRERIARAYPGHMFHGAAYETAYTKALEYYQLLKQRGTI